MIKDQWYVALESYELKNKPIGITRFGQKLVAWRDNSGNPHILMDQCPHRGCALSLGKMTGEAIQCPFHGFEFDSSGKCVLIPANGRIAEIPKVISVKSFVTREEHDYIWVWYGERSDNLPALPWFEDINSSFSYTSYHKHWPVHYSRAIENQLDVFHLPFVHGTTIGRGNRTVADGPIVEMNGEEMDIWVVNRIDDNRPSLRADQISKPNRPPFLRFIFPNNWMNRIAEDIRITVNFVPIDDDNVIFYLRNYVRKTVLPGIAKVSSWFMMLSGIIILNQDQKVVVSQRPIKTQLKMGEKLIPQDGPVILFRRHRQELMDRSRDS